MSFILDALKKSETERQRQNAPGFVDVPDGSKRSRAPRWLWVLGALLAVNFVVLLGVILRSDLRPVFNSPAAEDAPPAQTAPASDTSFAGIVEAARKTQSMQEDDAAGDVIAHDKPALEPATTSTPAPPVARPHATFNELRANGTLVLPDLHLDIHVYSEVPAERFVFVNMNKYREQAKLAEGPLVREITPDGVILEYLGTGFLLPRQ